MRSIYQEDNDRNKVMGPTTSDLYNPKQSQLLIITPSCHDPHYVILWRKFSMTATEDEEALRVEHNDAVDNNDKAPAIDAPEGVYSY